MTADGGLGGDLLAAFALMLVIEGIAYALFPDGMRRMLTVASAMPAAKLRAAGLLAATAGVVLVWLIRRFA